MIGFTNNRTGRGGGKGQIESVGKQGQTKIRSICPAKKVLDTRKRFNI
jgi:hypothetical protein